MKTKTNKVVTCRTCMVTYKNNTAWNNHDAYVNRETNPTKIESNWCLNCKHTAVSEYELFYTFPKVKRKIEMIKRPNTLF